MLSTRWIDTAKSDKEPQLMQVTSRKERIIAGQSTMYDLGGLAGSDQHTGHIGLGFIRSHPGQHGF